MQILHCGKARVIAAKNSYVLKSRLDQFAYQVLSMTICPKCNQMLMAWQGYGESRQPKTELFLIKQRDHQKWLQRIDPKNKIEYDLLHRGIWMEAAFSKNRLLVSDYTRLIAQDPANQLESLLNRFQVAS